MKYDLSANPLTSQVHKEKDDQIYRHPFFENFKTNLLSYKEAARYLSISESFLRRLKSQGRITFVPMGSRGIRFKLSSLDKWVEEREIK